MDENCGRVSRALMAIAASAFAALMFSGGLARAQTPKLKIGTLGAPSTSVWMVAVLQAQVIDAHRLVKRLPIETPGQRLARLLMNNPGCDNMKTTHKQLLSSCCNYLNFSCFASFMQP